MSNKNLGCCLFPFLQLFQTVSTEPEEEIEKINLETGEIIGGNELPEYPSDFFPHLKPGIRAMLMAKAVKEIHADFGEKIVEITEDFQKSNPKLGDLEAQTIAYKQITRRLSPYQNAIDAIGSKQRNTLENARKLEKDGHIDGAISLYKQLANEGFSSSLPYDRLRIILTREKRYQAAIDACQQYIDTLSLLSSLGIVYSNNSLIPRYEEWIKKLNARQEKNNLAKKP